MPWPLTIHKMSIIWPDLTDSFIEEQASLFRDMAFESLELQKNSLVPVEQFAELYLGYELDFVDDDGSLPEEVIGGIDFDSKTIIINSAIENHIGRYSFTIAHEIAHHVLHRDLFLAARSEVAIMCRGGSKRPIEEIQADRFAEALLMPLSIVKEHFKLVSGRKPISKNGRLALASKVIKSSGLLNVSVKAMAMRLQHLGLTPATNWFKNPIFRLIHQIYKKVNQDS